MRIEWLFAIALGVAACTPQRPTSADEASPGPLQLTHGVATGDVTDRTALVWTRASRSAVVHMAYDTSATFDSAAQATTHATAAGDYTARVRLSGLRPATRHYVRVWLESDEGPPARSQAVTATFVTAAAPSVRVPVRFVFAGDLGGQGYCRSATDGYEIFRRMREAAPDFFIANGDMIYADATCPQTLPFSEPAVRSPPRTSWHNVPGSFASIRNRSLDWSRTEELMPVYLEHWRYNRADPHFQSFLRDVPMYAQWDDHEVINDFGGRWSYWNVRSRDRTGYRTLVDAGRAAFFLFNPIDRHRSDPNRIYRSFRWGRDLELFIVDARSYRSRNDLADTAENDKTLLGADQLAWLTAGLGRSDATWKVVSVDVPMSVPTGTKPSLYGRDSWASGPHAAGVAPTGFERELLVLLARLDADDVENLVFLAADVHRAAVIRYELDADGDGDVLRWHELIAGPLNAGTAPTLTPGRLDRSLNPQLIYSEGGLFNFALVRVEEDSDGTVHLRAETRGLDGRARPGSTLDLVPQ